MSLKIFGGAAKGFTLAAPRNISIRPTSIQLRRKLFDSLQNIEEEAFVDLCCGTGAMGLEALSRGIGELYLVDKDTRLAKQNYQSLSRKFEILVPVYVEKGDAIQWLDHHQAWIKSTEPILFFDPPYEMKNLYQQFMQHDAVKYASRYIIEGCEQKTMKIGEFEELFGKANKTFRQGTSYFLIYQNDVG